MGDLLDGPGRCGRQKLGERLGRLGAGRARDRGRISLLSRQREAGFRGMKLRVPVSVLWTSMFKALGASPASINFNEVYSALQTKIVDGQENPLAIISAAKLYEVQKYCSMTNHMWDGYCCPLPCWRWSCASWFTGAIGATRNPLPSGPARARLPEHSSSRCLRSFSTPQRTSSSSSMPHCRTPTPAPSRRAHDCRRPPWTAIRQTPHCGRRRPDAAPAARGARVSVQRPGDVVVANDAATLPTSLRGVHSPSGEPIEVRLGGG